VTAELKMTVGAIASTKNNQYQTAPTPAQTLDF